MKALLPALCALALTTLLIVALAAGDPKRRRSARLAGEGQSSRVRRLLAAFACLPGILLAGVGDAAGLMLWLGGAAVVGWFVALAFAEAGKEAR